MQEHGAQGLSVERNYVELLPILLIFAVMMLPLLFLSNRQRKAQAKQQEMVKQLGIGDEVRTHSGFYGLIVESYDDVVVLESEDGTQTKWARMAIAMAVDPTGPADDEVLEGETAEDAEAPESSEASESSTSDRIPGVTVSDEDPREGGTARDR